jgi:CO/xanthine dehydrogenase Mo-binding subunit
LDQPNAPSLGGGEAAAGPTGAAIANALNAALGVRARHLPLSPDRLAQLIAS